MKTTMRKLGAGIAAGTVALLGMTAISTPSDAQPSHSSSQPSSRDRAIGLSPNGKHLSKFSLRSPENAVRLGRITGFDGDRRLVGIDRRVQDGRVYGVGNRGGVYTLNTSTARAQKVSELTVDMDGYSFGVDFNPAADRLRVVSNTGQNLRHDVNPGGVTTEDTMLTYPPLTTAATGITAAAYTNNDLDLTTGTTLIDVDTKANQAALQVPANDGLLSLTGPLGINAAAQAGFDIATTVLDGRAVTNTGYAVLKRAGSPGTALYAIDLFTGRATKIGGFAVVNVSDLAVVS